MKVDFTTSGPSKVFEVGVYSLENRRLPKVVVASRLCRDEGKMGVNCLLFFLLFFFNNFKIWQKVAGDETDLRRR